MIEVFVPIPDVYTVSMKRRRSGRLRNITVRAGEVMDACRQAEKYLFDKRVKGYRVYGVSQYRELQVGEKVYGV